MARRGDVERLDQIRDAIIDNPGRRPGWVARRLGFDNKTVMRALTQLEDRGELLTEDERGRLSWFGRRRS
jgi:predicted transcriptional regulator